MEERLKEVVRGKKVQLCCHWDADGVSSGAMIYHLIRNEADIKTISKGKPFLIEKKDINNDTEIIICVDIQPAMDLFDRKIVYIDHHPADFLDRCEFALYDEKARSCSLLIYEKLLKNKIDPYFIFLTLLGYFGDGGKREDIPKELLVNAQNFIPELMIKKDSFYSNNFYYEIEKYVSLLNTGKRRNWNGDIPLELLKCIDCYEPLVYNLHPLSQQLQDYKKELRVYYDQNFEIKELNNMDIVILSSDRNIQGVIAAKKMRRRPIIVVNQLNGEVIGSMRVPDNVEFDAGKFLENFNGKIEGFLGGGHEKAGGFTMRIEEFEKFIEKLKTN